MSVLLFDSASPNVALPALPAKWHRQQWTNWGMEAEPKLGTIPQGGATPPTSVVPFVLDDYEPDKVYDSAEAFARCAVTAVVRNPGTQHILYGAAPITAAQANPPNKEIEDSQLARLNPLYRILARINVWLALDLSFGPKQTMADWAYATPARMTRLHAIRAVYHVVPVLILGVRRGGGGKYAETTPHTEDELRAMATVARKSGVMVGVWAHHFDAEAAVVAGRAYGVLAEALASRLTPKPGVPTVGGTVAVAVPGPGVGGTGGGG